MEKIDGAFEDSLSYQVWYDTYKDPKDENIQDTWRRIAKRVASVEKDKEFWEDQFYDLLTDFKVTVGGRIYANAGGSFEEKTTSINCFVAPREANDLDSIEGIYRTLLEQTLTLKAEGGYGNNFSFIRPRGAFIHGIGVESPGAVKYMELFNKSSDVITAGSGKANKKGKNKIRKGAQMGIIDCWHPDIEEFIRAKQSEGRLDKFNISVGCYDDFMDLISEIETRKSNNKDYSDIDKWDLIFPDTTFKKYKKEWDGNIYKWKSNGYPIIVYKTIKASELWESIMQSTYNRNDPGVIFISKANLTHCWNYDDNGYIYACNPCGEQLLPKSGVCNLLSLNLTQFINKNGSSFDLDKVEKYTKIAVRFADNINDISNTPLPQYQESLVKRRRIGLGILGWGSSLYLLKTKFASNKASKLKNEVMKCITHTATKASVNLAEEKGMFTGCDPELHTKNIFWKNIELPKSILDKMKKVGIRNSALFSIQPTGNTSILANIVSGGLEPVFLQEYIRTVIVNSVPEELVDKCPKYWEGDYNPNNYFKLIKEGNDDVLRYDHNGTIYKIDKNRGLTKEVLCEDYGVRKLKSEGTWNPNADWACTAMSLSVKEHLKDLIEFGRWLDSSASKTINCPQDYPYEDFKTLYLDAYKSGVLKGITTYRAGTMASVLSEKSQKHSENDAAKRPQELPCDVYHISRNKQPYIILVGLLDGKPYEVFAISNNNDTVDNKVKKGKIIKLKRSKYRAEFEDDTELSPISAFTDNEEDVITRLVSTALRHNTPIEFIQHQLEKTEGDLNSLAKCISRALKKYIADGTAISGENCPECGGKLIRVEGCRKCCDEKGIDCLYSAC